jgi:hypothetical protein
MATKQEKIINGLFIGAIVVVIFIYIASRNKSLAGSLPSFPNLGGGGSTPINLPPLPSSGSGSSGGTITPPQASAFDLLPSVPETSILKKGNKNKQVWILQDLYNSRIASKESRPNIAVDGIFGNQTEGAIKYVTENNHTQISLQIWRVLTTYNKAQRVAYFN